MTDESQTRVGDGEEEAGQLQRDIDPDAQEAAGGGAEFKGAMEPVALHQGSFTSGQPSSMTSKVMVVVFVTMLIIGGMYVASPDDVISTLVNDRKGFDEEQNRNMFLGYKTPFLSSGVSHPVSLPVAEIRFAGGCPVIGVTVGDQHRAYPMITLMASFNRLGECGGIVNDSLGEMFITVANDSDEELVRVFRLAEGSRRKTIDLWLLGREAGGGMSLTFDKEGSFRHDAKEIEDLSDHPFKTATLAEWRAEHPETDVYVGEFSTPDLQMESTLQHMTTDERIEADRVLEERARQRKILSPKKTDRGTKSKSKQGDSAPQADTKADSSRDSQSSGADPKGPNGNPKSRVKR